jgi:6-phosphogluconolactonase
MFLVSGLEKAETLRAVLRGPYQPQMLPAQAIRPKSGKIVWLVDRDAASRLPRSN